MGSFVDPEGENFDRKQICVQTVVAMKLSGAEAKDLAH